MTGKLLRKTEVLVNTKLTMSQKCICVARKAKSLLRQCYQVVPMPLWVSMLEQDMAFVALRATAEAV